MRRGQSGGRRQVSAAGAGGGWRERRLRPRGGGCGTAGDAAGPRGAGAGPLAEQSGAAGAGAHSLRGAVCGGRGWGEVGDSCEPRADGQRGAAGAGRGEPLRSPGRGEAAPRGGGGGKGRPLRAPAWGEEGGGRRWGSSEPSGGSRRDGAVLEIGSSGAGDREATPSLGSAVDVSGERARALLRAPRSARQRCGGCRPPRRSSPRRCCRRLLAAHLGTPRLAKRFLSRGELCRVPETSPESWREGAVVE